jgi:hypothetical protein
MVETKNVAEKRRPEQMHSPVQRSSVPEPGDVLASRPTARADLYLISIVPDAAQRTARRYHEAVDVVRELARERSVDGWFTCDHTHYVRIAHHRREAQQGFVALHREMNDSFCKVAAT